MLCEKLIVKVNSTRRTIEKGVVPFAVIVLAIGSS